MKRSIVAAAVLALLLLAADASAQTLTVQTPIPNWTRGQPVAVPLVATPLGLGQTWSAGGGTFPPGLGVNALGLFSGTPTQAGTFTFTINVSDLTGGSGSRTYTMTIAAPPVIDQTTLPDAREGESYTTALTVTGGTAPIGYAVTAGALPGGLSLSPTTGVVTGAPAAEGTYGFTVTVSDAALVTASRALSIRVTTGPVLATSDPLDWTVGRPGFSAQVSAEGGEGDLSWDPPSGIPDGMGWALEDDVLTVSGTPSATGAWDLSVTVRDSIGQEATFAETVTIHEPPAIAAGAPEDATAGAGWNATPATSGGTPPLAFEVLPGSDPWIGIDPATGRLSGTPPAAGVAGVTVRVTDAAGASAERTFGLDVNEPPSLAEGSFAIAVRDEPFAAAVPAAGGTGALAADVPNGALPPGIGISGGVLSGTPTEAGSFDFSLRVRDRWGASAPRELSLLVGTPLAPNGKLPREEVPAGARLAYVYDLLAATALTAKVKVKGGASDLRLGLRMLDGSVVDAVPYRKANRRKIVLKKLPVPESGRYALVLESRGARSLDLKGKVKAKAAKRWRERITWGPATGERVFGFAAPAGAGLKVKAKAKGRGAPSAALSDLAGPAGSIDAGPYAKEKRWGFQLAKLVLAAGGDHFLAVAPGGAGTAQGTLEGLRLPPRPGRRQAPDDGWGRALLRRLPGRRLPALAERRRGLGRPAAPRARGRRAGPARRSRARRRSRDRPPRGGRGRRAPGRVRFDDPAVRRPGGPHVPAGGPGAAAAGEGGLIGRGRPRLPPLRGAGRVDAAARPGRLDPMLGRAGHVALLLLLLLAPGVRADDPPPEKRRMVVVCERGRVKRVKLYNREELTFRCREAATGVDGIFGRNVDLKGITWSLEEVPPPREPAEMVFEGRSRRARVVKRPPEGAEKQPLLDTSTYTVRGRRLPGRYRLRAEKEGFETASVLLCFARFRLVRVRSSLNRYSKDEERYAAAFEVELVDPDEEAAKVPIRVETVDGKGRVIDRRDDVYLKAKERWREFRSSRRIRVSTTETEGFRARYRRRHEDPLPPGFFDTQPLRLPGEGAIRISLRGVWASWKFPLGVR